MAAGRDELQGFADAFHIAAHFHAPLCHPRFCWRLREGLAMNGSVPV
jgi:hypothetical protein